MVFSFFAALAVVVCGDDSVNLLQWKAKKVDVRSWMDEWSRNPESTVEKLGNLQLRQLSEAGTEDLVTSMTKEKEEKHEPPKILQDKENEKKQLLRPWGFDGGSGLESDNKKQKKKEEKHKPPTLLQDMLKEVKKKEKKQKKKDRKQLKPKRPSIRCRGRPCWSVESGLDPRPTGMPKCQDALFEILEAVSDGLKKHGLEWNMCYGTLLGAVRDEDIIPWTADVDLCLPDESWQKVKNGGPGFLHESYTSGRDRFDDSVIRACQYFVDGEKYKFRNRNSNFVYVDIYNIETFKGVPPEEKQVFLKGPSKDVKVRGVNFNAPQDAEKFLELHYGDWRTPDPQRRSHGLSYGPVHP